MRSLLLLSFLVCTGLATAQTWFHLNTITIEPSAPTAGTNVTVHLHGDLSDSGAEIIVAEAGVAGSQVDITLVANSTGGFAVLVPHTVSLPLGPLAAGTYTIAFTDATAHITDWAPTEQHTFVVSGDEFPCADLDISVQWHPFTDTSLVVHVRNNSTEQFDYPNFILFDAAGDTMALEAFGQFMITSDSWHLLPLAPGAQTPPPTVNGTLELWKGLGATRACKWTGPFLLCPPPPCTMVYPSMGNYGGGITIGTFQWSIANEVEVIASGQFTLTDVEQSASDSICLSPGHYVYTVTADDPPTSGVPMSFVSGPGWNTTAMQHVWASSGALPFSLYGPCLEDGQSVAEQANGHLAFAPRSGGIQLWRTDGEALGVIDLFDVRGRLLQRTRSAGTHLFLAVDVPGVYVVRTPDGALRVAITGE